MSSASKSKNISSKTSGNGNRHNPNAGKIHSVDTSAPSSISPLCTSSRFSSMDETHDPYETSGKEYDTVSNNSSWSADSEDHKEKPPQHLPSLQVDNEKREKIRLKNEKKHQRQKERRAQELHDRCTGFIVSRKVEALSQQLVSMGFSLEKSKLALMVNQGKIEDSILWLIEVGNDKHKEHNLQVSNSKVDISDELARIADMEIRYKSSKQDVERAIVSSEGDLDKAEQLLCATKEMKKSPVKEANNLGKRDPVILMQRPKSEVSQTRKVSVKSENKRGNSEPISVVSSLGLFTGLGSTSGSSGPSSPVDWNSVGSLLMRLDYKNVDWTLNRVPPREWSSPFEERDLFTLPRQFVSPSI